MPSTISAGTTAGTAIAIAGDTSGVLALQTNGTTTAMTIDTSQIVAMGTTDTSNTTRLKVQGGSTNARATSAQLSIQRNTTSTQYEGVCFVSGPANSAFIGRLPNSDDVTFGFDAGASLAERMRITSGGDLLINTTTTNAAFKGFRMYSEAQGSYSAMGATGTGAYDFFSFYRGTDGSMTRIGFISTSGSGTSYSTTSDYRLKENIAPMTGALAKVAQLKPVTYTWKTDGSDGQGFIAHELQAVVPDAVTGEKDAVNEDGSIKPQGVDTSFLVATLTAAIQELKAELDATKAEVAALKGA